MARSSTPDPPFRHALVAVCHECSGHGPEPKAVRSRLRGTLKEAGLRKAVRVVRSGCLDLCPKRAVAVVVALTSGAGGTTCHVVASEGDLERLATALRDGAADEA